MVISRGMSMVSPHILIVDDHPIFREGFGHLVRALRSSWVIEFADSAAAAIAAFSCRPASLVIIDVGLPDGDGFALFEEIVKLSPHTPQIMMSGRDDAAVRMRTRAIGARAFISKSSEPEQVLMKIESILMGEAIFEPSGGNIPALTARQTEVLMLLAQGLGNKEIRHRLNIAERTVRAHLTEIFQMLAVHSRMQAIVRARELGLIP